jgi:hypothetical protein
MPLGGPRNVGKGFKGSRGQDHSVKEKLGIKNSEVQMGTSLKVIEINISNATYSHHERPTNTP